MDTNAGAYCWPPTAPTPLVRVSWRQTWEFCTGLVTLANERSANVPNAVGKPRVSRWSATVNNSTSSSRNPSCQYPGTRVPNTSITTVIRLSSSMLPGRWWAVT
eukprot:2412739-Rhodomonas_salina.3